MEITFVTTNARKVQSLQRAIERTGTVVRQIRRDFFEPQVSDIREIATHKAMAAFSEFKAPLLVQDAGFFLDATPGFPGAFVKFVKTTIGTAGLLKLVEGHTRTCAFRECLVYHDGHTLHYFESTIPGYLADRPRGIHVSDPAELWTIFIPEGLEKTLSEMTDDELAQWRIRRPKNWSDLFAEWYLNSHTS